MNAPGQHPRLVCLVASLFVALPGAVRAAEEDAPQFSRHVVPVLARLGCNAGGACHGTVLGQGGFRLSLFGAQPALDHQRLTREVIARRLTPHQPEESLILLKATGAVPHGGGKRISSGSSEYEVIRRWIAAGAPLDDLSKSRLTGLTLNPSALTLKPGATGKFQVTATYADGTTADVTHLCRYETNDDEVARIDATGTVTAQRGGDTAAVIRYGSEPVLASVIVVPAEVKQAFPEAKAHNFIDEHVLARLKALDLPPAQLCDDATFLRRLHLDILGYLPTPEEVRAFLADKAPDKRTKKIDEVLARPGYAEVWASKFSDLIKPVERGNEGNNNIMQGQVLRIRFYEWLRARLQENVPYDQLVERMFLSSSLDGRKVEEWLAEREALQAELAAKKDKARPVNEPLLAAYNQRRTLDLYWERDGATGVVGAMQFSHAFLGLRMQCAQCHRHPADVWQQEDLLSFANFFMAMNTAGQRKNSPEVQAYADKLKPEIMMWAEEAKKLNASKDAADKKKGAELQQKINAATSFISAEIAPLTSGPVGTASVRNTLGTQQSAFLRLLGEKNNTTLAPDQDRRQVVMDWLRRPDNPYFARAMVNRVWAHYLGRGIVDPPDNLSPLNPPSHPKLLDELAQGFIKNGYDLKWLHRTILQSRTYQQSHEAHAASIHDTRNYARFQLRRLPGEVILDVVNQATGASDKYNASWLFRDGERAVLVSGVMVDVFTYQQSTDPFRYLVFGRQVRRPLLQCDCEQGKEVTLPQLFFLANHPEIRQKIALKDGWVAKLADNKDLDDRQRMEELFLRSLARLPSADELKAGLEHLKASKTMKVGLEDVLWSLVNIREFQLCY